ncbi:MAG: 2-C-methyl-D-erythritol 4-phosphate cytidylyltransferase [Candidatus Omnitrophica bacterium]|nr:2-C-methyl-D-erythritol 4-phosphate cytidylyltransferase [Candidatus Omnitrophota bacterium]
MKVAVILASAGRGRRLGLKIDKPFVNLGGKPLLFYSIETFLKIDRYIDQIVVVCRRKYFSLIKREFSSPKITLTEGGRRRQDSVYLGLKAVKESIEYVIIHDGARPFVKEEKVKEIVNYLRKGYVGVTLGLPENDCLKLIERGAIKKTVERREIYRIQTPQGFKKEVLFDAYQRFRRRKVYDDSQFLELLGKKVKMVEGDYLNIKITYPQDLILGELILKMRDEKRSFKN